jgi:hypothetical protein
MIRIFVHPSGQTQRLAVADLTRGGVAIFAELLASVSAPVALVYSDPPWSPGNEKWWRRHAGEAPPEDYARLLNAWCWCAAMCNPEHVLCEQSVNAAHRQLLLDAVSRQLAWNLPLLEHWTVYYGNPLRPNVLLHWGNESLVTDPSEMYGEAMTRRVFEGIAGLAGRAVADPCMGLGMTSRMAHRFGQHCIGTELNPKRLERSISWLLRHGYQEQAP